MQNRRIVRKVSFILVAVMMIVQISAPINVLATTIEVKASNQVATVEQGSKALVVGQVYEGFKLEKQNFSKDLNAEMYLFVHEKNGGQLVYIDSPDKNKWFSVIFRTPTVDNTGVNHILEHTVLEGSEKYGGNSPFVEMSKRSVNTYMNALTYTDSTCYPIASENDKDFDNLMKVYLDAVFAPLVVKENKFLQQEGWRYELDTNTGEMMFNGVVFNEMKGAMADRYSVVFQKLQETIYPDTKYKYNSGGNPLDIVDLTNEQLADIYAQYYTASNSCIMLYGNMNVVEKLKYINDEYYNKMEKKPAIIDKKEQTPFASPKSFVFNYPSDTESNPETDSILLWSAALSGTNEKDRLGLAILSSILSYGDSAALYKNITENNLGKTVYAGLEDAYYQPAFTVMVEGASNQSMVECDKVVQATFKEMVDNGISKDRIAGMLSQYELSFKSELLTANKGESAMNFLKNGFVTYADPLLNFNSSELLAQIKKEAANGRYFEKLIEKYLINNPHQINITFEPDADYMTQMDKLIDEKLKARVEKFSGKELQDIQSDIKDYSQWQAKKSELESLEELPYLTIEDLDLTAKENKVVDTKIGETRLLKHSVNALGLTELSLYFDLQTLTQKELEYLQLFKSMVESSDTDQYTQEQLDNEINQYTMGISMYEKCYKDLKDSNKYYPYFVVKVNYANENASKVSTLIEEKLLKVKLDDKELMKTKLSEIVDNIKREKSNNTNDIVTSKIYASLTAEGVFGDIKYNQGFQTLSDADKDFEKAYQELQKNLNSIYTKIFNAKNMTVSIATDENSFEINEQAVETLLKVLNNKELKLQNWELKPKKQKIALITSEEVQYLQMGFNLDAIGETLTGQDLVFANIISEGYMYENIRLKSGAYGGIVSISSEGSIRFITYRDPNLKESVDAIENVIQYLKNYKPSVEEINDAIIAVAGKMEQGVDLFEETSLEDGDKLAGLDETFKQRLKNEILNTKPEDLQKFTSKMEKGLKEASLVVAGSEKQIQANTSLFETVKPIQQ